MTHPTPDEDGKIAIVVDDDRTVRAILLDALAARGYQVVEAATGREAIDAVSGALSRLELVVLDLTLPDMDGFEVLTQIREPTKDAGVGIIVVTGSDGEMARLAVEFGADDVLLKGSSLEEIAAHVDLVVAERARSN